MDLLDPKLQRRSFLKLMAGVTKALAKAKPEGVVNPKLPMDMKEELLAQRMAKEAEEASIRLKASMTTDIMSAHKVPLDYRLEMSDEASKYWAPDVLNMSDSEYYKTVDKITKIGASRVEFAGVSWDDVSKSYKQIDNDRLGRVVKRARELVSPETLNQIDGMDFELEVGIDGWKEDSRKFILRRSADDILDDVPIGKAEIRDVPYPRRSYEPEDGPKYMSTRKAFLDPTDEFGIDHIEYSHSGREYFRSWDGKDEIIVDPSNGNVFKYRLNADSVGNEAIPVNASTGFPAKSWLKRRVEALKKLFPETEIETDLDTRRRKEEESIVDLDKKWRELEDRAAEREARRHIPPESHITGPQPETRLERSTRFRSARRPALSGRKALLTAAAGYGLGALASHYGGRNE
jgi:hypothetical protein